MNIQEMELLVRVAEAGSMTRAAQQMQLTPAAVSAAVQRVERAVGIRLFHRTTRSIHPTDEGLILIDGSRKLVEMWRQTVEDARGHRAGLTGTINLSAPTDTTYSVLDPVLVELCSAHPELRVVLKTSDDVLDLHRNALDIAIRYGQLQDSTLTARKILESPTVLVASPSYLAEKPPPGDPGTATQPALPHPSAVQRAHDFLGAPGPRRDPLGAASEPPLRRRLPHPPVGPGRLGHRLQEPVRRHR
ncbi:MAG: LysR family transcriptional regulator [Myxococcota bacterium]